MTGIAHNTIEHEELLRAYWMTEMLDSISTIGSKHQLGFLEAPINHSYHAATGYGRNLIL